MLRLFPPLQRWAPATEPSPPTNLSGVGLHGCQPRDGETVEIAPVFHGRLKRNEIDASTVGIFPADWSARQAGTVEGEIANDFKARATEFFSRAGAATGPADIRFSRYPNKFDVCTVPVDAVVRAPDGALIVMELFLSLRGYAERSDNLRNAVMLARVLDPRAHGCRLVVDCSRYNEVPLREPCFSISKLERRIGQYPPNPLGVDTIRIDAVELAHRMDSSGAPITSVIEAFVSAHNAGLVDGLGQRRALQAEFERVSALQRRSQVVTQPDRGDNEK